MPKIAIVLGASGAAHFVSGIRRAREVISVNRDATVPINTHADYYVVDDVGRFLPVLLMKLVPARSTITDHEHGAAAH